jgi:hypothetical protein
MLLPDITAYYHDADELPELADALCELTCFECCNLFVSENVTERFCSMACESRWCRRVIYAAQLPVATDCGDIPF